LIELRRRFFAGHGIHIFDNGRMILGFTETGFSAVSLRRYFPSRPLLFLKQVHSDRIVTGNDWWTGLEGDGLFLDRPQGVAVIQTADCLPLFFYKDDFSRGGVVHIGWRGLWQGIEKKLIQLLAGERNNYFFYLGPAIEKSCYEVGEELPGLFADKAYAAHIFTKLATGKYAMDIKAGVTLSLLASGIAADRIGDSHLCTFCSQNRFPSYRRDGKTGKRIYNFFALSRLHPVP
jgi:polyphenol oxidase